MKPEDEFAESTAWAQGAITDAAARMRTGDRAVPRHLRLPRRLLVPVDLPGGGMRFTDEQQRAIDRRDGSLLVSAGAGTGKTSVLVERFVRAVLEDGVPWTRILAITFTEKAAAQLTARVRARLMALGARTEARARPRRPGSPRSTASARGCCAPTRSRRASTPSSGCSTRSRPSGWASTRSTARSRSSWARARIPSGCAAGLLHARTGWPTWCAPPTPTARSRGEAQAAAAEAVPPQAGRRARGAGGRRAAPRWPSWRPRTASRRRGAREARALRRAGRGARRRTAWPSRRELKELAFKGTAKALQGAACEEYRAAHDAYLRRTACATASTPTTCCCAT